MTRQRHAEDLGRPDGHDAAGDVHRGRGHPEGAGPVQFQRERVTGSGVGFTYDRTLDRLWLLDQAVINVAPPVTPAACRSRSGSAGHSRAERYMRFERGMRMEREGQVMEADHVDGVPAQGSRRARDAWSCAATRDHRQRRHGLAAGDAGARHQPALRARRAHPGAGAAGRPEPAFNSHGRTGRAGQQLAAEYDRHVARARRRGHRAHRPRQRPRHASGHRPTPARTSHVAARLDGVGAAGPRADRDDLRERRRVSRGRRRRGRPARVARARTLKAAMSPQLARSTRRDFSGGFRFEDGRWSRRAPTPPTR